MQSLTFVVLGICWVAVAMGEEYQGTVLTKERFMSVCACFKAGIKNKQIVECIRKKKTTDNLNYAPMNVTSACSEHFGNAKMSKPETVGQNFKKMMCGKMDDKDTLPLIECLRKETTKHSLQEDIAIATKANIAMKACGVELGCFKQS